MDMDALKKKWGVIGFFYGIIMLYFNDLVKTGMKLYWFKWNGLGSKNT